MAKLTKDSDLIVRLGLPLLVNVIIEDHEVIGNSYVLYDLKVIPNVGSMIHNSPYVEFLENGTSESTGNDSSWLIQRRFSNISVLHEALEERFVNLPDFPSKTVMRNFTYAHIKKRVAALNSYFNQITTRRDVMSCEIVHAFLDFSEYSRKYMMSIPSQNSVVNVFPSKAVTFPLFPSSIFTIKFSKTNQFLVVGSSTDTWVNKPASSITLWIILSNGDIRMESEISFSMKLNCLCFHNQDEYILLGSSNGKIQCLKRTYQGFLNCSNDFDFPVHCGAIQAIISYPREGWIFSGGTDAILRIFSFRENLSYKGIDCPANITCFLIDETEGHLFTGYSNGEIGIFDLISTPIQPLAVLGRGLANKKYSSVPIGKISAIALDSSSQSLFTANDAFISVWDLKNISRHSSNCHAHTFPCSTSEITTLSWCSKSGELLCGTKKGAVVSVFPFHSTVSYFFDCHLESVTCIYWNEQRRHLFTAGKDRSIIVWKYVHFKNIGLRGLPLLNTATSNLYGNIRKSEKNNNSDKTLLTSMRELPELVSSPKSDGTVEYLLQEIVSPKNSSVRNSTVDPLLGVRLQKKD